eukprot:gb/GFBE01025068.1/.p1 GENE.gb/GFBE01025068.1/~~gb/GFBE01025068.1/.p1  ORF type:complete len:213 (+),score=27.28 gb/GFBE01025068.1/:1-639(+)
MPGFASQPRGRQFGVLLVTSATLLQCLQVCRTFMWPLQHGSSRRSLLSAGLTAAVAPEVHAARGAGLFASCSMEVAFPSASCSAVQAEVEARARGDKGWYDPHNQGSYSLSRASPGKVEGSRVTGFMGGPEVGGPFTDKWSMSFSDRGAGCAIRAQSQATGLSMLDDSTNYCNLHNLYCGKVDGCTTVKHDLAYSETLRQCNEHEKSVCVTV